MRVEFGGKASKEPTSLSDSTPGYESYANRVTEIWFGAKELMRTGQIKGVPQSLARELCARTYKTAKGEKMRLMAEPKADMKMRIGKSPDEADAALMLVALCKERFGFGASRATSGVSTGGFNTSNFFRRLSLVGNPKNLRS